jgi:hypothetical protein
LEKLLTKLSKFWWSDRHPNDYLIRDQEKVVGVGLLARQSYAAFNLAYAAIGKEPELKPAQLELVSIWPFSVQLTMVQCDGYTVGDKATLCTPLEFVEWYESSNRAWFTDQQKSFLLLVCKNILLKEQFSERTE